MRLVRWIQRVTPSLRRKNERSIVTYTSRMDLQEPSIYAGRPAFRIISEHGELGEESILTPESNDQNLWKKFYESMVELQIMDQIMFEVQRQGRIPFYLTCSGEEGINIGAGSGLEDQDVIFGQYREAGVLMWRGLGLDEIMDQCFSTVDDAQKGRQMPMHYGCKRLNIHTISSPLATQIPQAAGVAYSLKMNPFNDAIAVAFFGEGAASEGDFHAAMNFGSTLDCPVLFFCRNNGYAISTPSSSQFRGDGIASRAEGYGMASLRVDGNDVLAVREATIAARKYCLENNRPLLLEAMTYRLGHHSTSDDSTRYRDSGEMKYWQSLHPIDRFKKFLQKRGLWDKDQDAAFRRSVRKKVLAAISKAEEKPSPAALENLFTDVYDEIPPHLLRQKIELEQHVDKYPSFYGVST